MYPVTNGNTHVDKNEIIPATNAAKIETCIASFAPTPSFCGLHAAWRGPIVPYPAGPSC